uniref:Uncharacterized protein n=1 Tax=viral metagenome TaxID=1070528 RepID=A0A6C0DJG1_9ZZZZ
MGKKQQSRICNSYIDHEKIYLFIPINIFINNIQVIVFNVENIQ